MQINKGKGLQIFKGLLSSLLMLWILVIGLGVTVYGYEEMLQAGYEQELEVVVIQVGESKQLHLRDNCAGEQIWVTLDKSIASVGVYDGIVTGVSEGTTHVAGFCLETEYRTDFQIIVVPQGYVPTVTQVSLGDNHTLALRSDGTLWAWGNNEHGQLGNGSINRVPAPIEIMENVKYISAGDGHSMAITNDGGLYVWGNNEYGQIGDGTTTNRHEPVHIMYNVSYAYAANGHSMAITNDGDLYVWGNNGRGQVGNGTSGNIVPEPVRIKDNVKQVTAGSDHSVAVTNDNSLYAWGSNGFHQLGDPKLEFFDNLTTPIRITGDFGAIEVVAAGDAFTLIIDKNGYIWGWGLNMHGQIGDGNYSGTGVTYTREPYKLSLLRNISHVATGGTHSLAVSSNGILYAWGNNVAGQVGDGSTGTLRPNPMVIKQNVVYATGGGLHSAAITADGDLYIWGRNIDGELGIGSDDRFVPTPARVNFPE